MEMESVCRIDNLQIVFVPEAIKSQPGYKRSNGCMNMDEVVLLLDREVPNPADHPEVPRI
jgi:hypothetical protein